MSKKIKQNFTIALQHNSAELQQSAWRALQAWLTSAAGSYLLEWEQAQFAELTADIFGFNALQIGLPQVDLIAASRMPNKWLLNDMALRCVASKGRAITLLADFNELPLESQSVDLIILPHVLEFAAEPHQILREVERVLIPEGRLIVSGFNGASLWGARQAFGRLSGRYFLPQQIDIIRPARLKDWLKLLNMEVGRTHFGAYAPPFNNQKWLQRCDFFDVAGARWCPYFGAAYVVEAIKRVKGMHLIGPVWKNKKVKITGAIPVTNRHSKIDK